MQTLSLSSKEWPLRDLFCGEHHIFRFATATAAICRVDVPIRAANIVSGGVPEGARYPIDRFGLAFEFQEHADWRFIQVHVEAAQAETGAVLLVTEGWLES